MWSGGLHGVRSYFVHYIAGLAWHGMTWYSIQAQFGIIISRSNF